MNLEPLPIFQDSQSNAPICSLINSAKLDTTGSNMVLMTSLQALRQKDILVQGCRILPVDLDMVRSTGHVSIFQNSTQVDKKRLTRPVEWVAVECPLSPLKAF